MMKSLSLALGLLSLLTICPMQVGVMAQNDTTPDFLRNNVGLESSCATLQDCQNCTNTYTCHWCDSDNACHAKASYYGCSWGSSCTNPKPKPPKENSTCASKTTCSKCAVESHLCHWCEYDNSCHAIGSKYGCSVGVDCYSNDRCRRSEPEKFGRFVFTEIPMTALVILLLVGTAVIGCLSCCCCFWGGVKGAYDDLATISMAASLPPSVIGGTLMLGTAEPFYTILETHPEEEEERTGEEGGNGPNNEPQQQQPEDEEANQQQQPPTEEAGLAETNEQSQQPHREECQTNPYVLMNDHGGHNLDSTPLLHPSSRSYNGIPGMEEPRHMKALSRMCSIMYYISVFLVLTFVASTIYFYPKKPVYNVCNDDVAWKKIMANIVAFKLDISFEILITVSNPNHLSVVLDQGKGSFTFDGNPVGTFEIPGDTVSTMAMTDLMLIARVTPDKYQAVQMVEAYHRGKLVLEAEFKAKLRVPALLDLTYNLDAKDITVYVNELGDRSLCHCPSWDDGNNKSSDMLLF